MKIGILVAWVAQAYDDFQVLYSFLPQINPGRCFLIKLFPSQATAAELFKVGPMFQSPAVVKSGNIHIIHALFFPHTKIALDQQLHDYKT